MKRTAIRKRRPTLRRGELTKLEKEAIRRQVYADCGGQCELNLAPECIKGMLPYEGETPWDHWHLVHRRNKRMHGWKRENLCGGCPFCHLVVLHSYGKDGKKPVPKKEAA
jgi:hypothetical protein